MILRGNNLAKAHLLLVAGVFLAGAFFPSHLAAAPACGHHPTGPGGTWVEQRCPAPAVCGGGGQLGVCGVPPWSRLSNEFGSFDFPLITYWNGFAWVPHGTAVDPRSEQPAQPIHHPIIDYNRYAWERTGHPRTAGGTAHTTDDFRDAMKILHLASGVPVHYYNSWDRLQADGTATGIQVLPMVYTGQPVVGSPTPEADGVDHNSGASLFAVLFPPGYDASRAERYPILMFFPGGGGTHLHGVMGPLALGLEVTGRLLAKSVEEGGSGMIVVYSNAGGQGSHGVQEEHQDAVDELFGRIHDIWNGDKERVALAGGSRGAGDALYHGARPTRVHRTLAAFAGVPPSDFEALARLPLNLNPLHAFLSLPNFTRESALGTTDIDRFDELTAIGQIDHWDEGAWVEICDGPRDWTGGVQIAFYYYKNLPPHVSGRYNNTLGSGHGGNSLACGEHLELFVLDELVGNAAYAGRFRTEVAAGVFHDRLRPNTAADPFPARLPSHFEPLTATGCGDEMPVVLALPLMQQRDDPQGSFEPSGFVLGGDRGRSWEVRLVEPATSTVLAQWSGVLGGAASSFCDPFPQKDSEVGHLCRFDRESDLCTPVPGSSFQVCRWQLFYDCDGDGVPEAIPTHYQPFRNDPESHPFFGSNPQPDARLFVSPFPCFSFEQCGMATEAGHQRPYNPHVGLPQLVTPCMNPGSTDCSP